MGASAWVYRTHLAMGVTICHPYLHILHYTDYILIKLKVSDMLPYIINEHIMKNKFVQNGQNF